MSRPLILKRASISRPGGQWKDEGYDVLADGKPVGRIYEPAGSRFDPPELRWFWSPGAADSETRLRTDECLRAAKEEGIPREDIEEEVGDLAAYMNSVVAELITQSETAPSDTVEDDREQRIRSKAYQIWLDEGCPEGRAEAHWDMATELVAIKENYASTQARPKCCFSNAHR